MKFGKYSELLKITEDPEAYVREKIREWNEEHQRGKVSYTVTTDLHTKVKQTDGEASSTTWRNVGYFFLQDIMKGLCLKQFFSMKTEGRKITFDCFTIARFLVYARILDPRSKLGTWDRLSSYYEEPDFGYQHILRFMDLLADNYNDYLAWLYQKRSKIVKRDTSVLYYDCTNFYFECEQPDEDVVDEATGELIQGLRQFGVSKEHRPNPIVEMGLFMDSRGIPISMCLHPGNTNEQTTAVPLEQEILKMTEGTKFIYCADAGLGSYHIRQFNSMGGRSFIVTQSIKKMSGPLKQAVFNDYDYRLLSDDSPVTIQALKDFDRSLKQNLPLYNDLAYKIIIADAAVDLGLYEEKKLKNGRTVKVKATGMLKQRVIITFSRKMLEYQRAVRNRQVERAKKLLDLKDPEEIKKGPNDVRRFMKRVIHTANDETDGKKTDADEKDVPEDNGDKAKKKKKSSKEKVTVEYILDEAKIREEEKYDGYYAVATNLESPAKEILEISHKRYQIEDCFRIMKTNFTGRPVNHRLQNRIKAHFLICYTALLVYRLLEVRLDDQGTHVTTDNMIETLRNLNVANVYDMEYMALYTGSKALDALNQLTSLNLDLLHYGPKELDKKIKKILR